MPNIPTTQETIQALDVLRRFVEGIEQTFIGIRGTTNTPLPLRSADSEPVNGDEPTTWAARVLAILDDKGKYTSPKDVIAEYRLRGWKEIPDIDIRIRSTLGQLKKADKVLHNKAKQTYKVKKEAN